MTTIQPNNGGEIWVPFVEGSIGWVIEIWRAPLPLGGSNPESPVYWNGPPHCRASNLGNGSAVFEDAETAREIFRTTCLPLPLMLTRWDAVTVEEALTRQSPPNARHQWGTARSAPD